MNYIKTFEDLREFIWEAKQDAHEALIEQMFELPPHGLGAFKGEIECYDSLLDVLREIIKHQDDSV